MLLIFDLDGTIMDTWDDILLTFRKVFKKRGLALDEKKLRMAVGLPLDRVVEMVAGYPSPEIVEDIRDTFLAQERRNIKLFPGIEEVLKLPFKKAVLTSKGDLGTYRDLDTLKIRNYFEIIVTADTVKRKKPDPEGINIILERTGANRKETFMIGDTELDILAGKNAGVKTVAVSWGNRDAEYLKKYAPHHIVSTPAELKNLLENYAHL